MRWGLTAAGRRRAMTRPHSDEALLAKAPTQAAAPAAGPLVIADVLSRTPFCLVSVRLRVADWSRAARGSVGVLPPAIKKS
jgi:hypothetical protein